MKINNFLQKTASGLLATVLAFAPLAVSAEGTTYTAIHGGTVNVEKYLIMDTNANVPNVTFDYTIAPGTAQNASGSNAHVFAGPSGALIGTAAFTT